MTSSIENEEKPTPIIFGDESLSDIILVVDNQDFKANKMFLACRSEVFKVMFLGNFKESQEDRVEIKDVSAENFRRFLEIVYTGKTSDPSKFLEFEFINDTQHYGVSINGEGAEPSTDGSYQYTPSLAKLFHNFWKNTTEILNIADRFNLISLVKDYFGSIIIPDIRCCKKEKGCYQCFNMLMLALINGMDVSKCKKKHLKSYYDEWISYAGEKPFPENIPVKVIKTLYDQFLE